MYNRTKNHTIRMHTLIEEIIGMIKKKILDTEEEVRVATKAETNKAANLEDTIQTVRCLHPGDQNQKIEIKNFIGKKKV